MSDRQVPISDHGLQADTIRQPPAFSIDWNRPRTTREMKWVSCLTECANPNGLVCINSSRQMGCSKSTWREKQALPAQNHPSEALGQDTSDNQYPQVDSKLIPVCTSRLLFSSNDSELSLQSQRHHSSLPPGHSPFPALNRP